MAASSASAATTITISPKSQDYGSVNVGKSSGPLSFKLEIRTDDFGTLATFNPVPASTNSAFQLLNLCPAQISYLAFFVGDDDPICHFVARFAPTSPGPQSATITTGTGGPTATLTGTGVAPATAPATQATAGKCKKGGKKKGRAAKKCKKKKRK